MTLERLDRATNSLILLAATLSLPPALMSACNDTREALEVTLNGPYFDEAMYPRSVIEVFAEFPSDYRSELCTGSLNGVYDLPGVGTFEVDQSLRGGNATTGEDYICADVARVSSDGLEGTGTVMTSFRLNGALVTPEVIDIPLNERTDSDYWSGISDVHFDTTIGGQSYSADGKVSCEPVENGGGCEFEADEE